MCFKVCIGYWGFLRIGILSPKVVFSSSIIVSFPLGLVTKKSFDYPGKLGNAHISLKSSISKEIF